MKKIIMIILASFFCVSCSDTDISSPEKIETDLSVIYDPLETFKKGVKAIKSFSDTAETYYYWSEYYDYNSFGKVTKKSNYGHNDSLLFYYDEYFYNDNEQLIKIVNYHSNSNEPSGFLNLIIREFHYNSGLLEKETTYYPKIDVKDISYYNVIDGELKTKTYFHNSILDYMTVYNYDNGKQIGKVKYEMRSSFGAVIDSVTYKYEGKFIVEELHSTGDILWKRVLYSYNDFGKLIMEDIQVPHIFSSELEQVIKYYY